MIDIHSHILPNLDDGAASEEISRSLLRSAFAGGTHAIIATPHVLESVGRIPWEDIAGKTAELNAFAKAESLPICVYAGCELELNADLLEIVAKDSDAYCLAGSRYILLELPSMSVPRESEEMLYQLQLKDKRPIIAHPERNMSLMKQPDRFMQWLRNGVHLQCNASSFTGFYGPEAQSNAELLLRNGLVSFIGSDAHNLERRTTDLREPVAAIEALAGALAAAQLTVTNPQRILDDKVFYVDVPKELVLPAAAKQRQQKKQGFWSNLFHK